LKIPKFYGESSYDVLIMPTKLENEIWPVSIRLLRIKLQFCTFFLKN